MFGYREYVYDLYVSARIEALRLAQSLVQSVQGDLDPTDLARLREGAVHLRYATDDFVGALPADVVEPTSANLKRHLAFIELYLRKGQPRNCMHDPLDIAGLDLPAYWQRFEDWHVERALADEEFTNRTRRLVVAGHTSSAIREAFAIFKTRMVSRFHLSHDLDGERLAAALFGSGGATARLLTGSEREGRLNLYRGLYALFRNPAGHNDLVVDEGQASAVLALLGSLIAELDPAVPATAAPA